MRLITISPGAKKLIKEWGEGVAIGPRAIEAREAAENQVNPNESTS